MYFGRFENGTLESPFAGNLIDICPTGVFTDKAARYKVRGWDLERSPSICLHCSLGCHTTACARYREVVRQEARFSAEVNGHFLCDRGRYGFAYANLPQRPRAPRLEQVERPADVHVGVEPRVGDRPPHVDLRRVVDEHLDAGARDQRRGLRGADVEAVQLGAGRDVLLAAARQVVDNQHAMPGPQQGLGDVGPDEASAPGDTDG